VVAGLVAAVFFGELLGRQRGGRLMHNCRQARRRSRM
jgi:hypothetical protein